MILPNGLEEELQFLDDESKEIVELLFSTNEDDRLVSAVTLQQLGDEDTIPFLIHALDDSSTSVQLIAVTSLWEMANEKAVIPLMKCINSKRVEKVREEACNALKELINQDHLLKLLDLLETEDDTQKIYVLILLRKIHDIQALPSIADFLKSSAIVGPTSCSEIILKNDEKSGSLSSCDAIFFSNSYSDSLF